MLKITDQNNYFNKARQLHEEGKLQLALHIIDVVIKGADERSEVFLEACKLKVKNLNKRAKDEMSFIAQNILNSSANQMKAKIKKLRKNPLE